MGRLGGFSPLTTSSRTDEPDLTQEVSRAVSVDLQPPIDGVECSHIAASFPRQLLERSIACLNRALSSPRYSINSPVLPIAKIVRLG